MRRYDYLLWDLDGTLLNTLDDLTDATNYILRQYGYPPKTAAEIRLILGNGAAQQIRLSSPGGVEPPEFEEMLSGYKTYYAAHSNRKTAPYPGIPEVLSRLSRAGFSMAMVTNKPAAAAETLHRQYFAADLQVAMGETSALPRKPAPDMVWAAMKQLGAVPGRTVYIGDSEVDLKTASNAGLPCISVTWGFRDPDVLLAAGAETLIDSPAALAEYLLQEMP